jgi:hypothetical protein
MENALVVALAHHIINLMTIRAQDVLFTPSKVCMHLPRQQCVLRDVRPSRVFVKRKKKQPDDADRDAKEGQVRGKLQDSRIATQRERRC